MNILITGGASGLGEAITRKLASESSDKIFFTYNSSSDRAKNIEEIFPNAKGIHCNFSEQPDLDSLFDFMQTADLDVLVNNAFASSIHPERFHKTDVSVFVKNFQANFIPIIQITQKAITAFRKKKSGKIITMLSSYLIGNPPIGLSEYTASKAYLESLSKSWATENIAFNITSNSVSPSFMLTNLTSDTDERTVEQIQMANPLKKILSTDEVADAVQFLSKCTNQINGINLIINSGSNVV